MVEKLGNYTTENQELQEYLSSREGHKQQGEPKEPKEATEPMHNKKEVGGGSNSESTKADPHENIEHTESNPHKNIEHTESDLHKPSSTQAILKNLQKKL